MSVPAFPRALLREKSHSWNVLGVAATPGQTADNVSVVVRSDGGGFWSCMMSSVSLGARAVGAGHARQRNTTLLWRAVRQIANGGATALIVPRNDALFRPWPVGVPQGAANIPHGDGSLFDDDVGYYQPTIDVTCGSASLRATQLLLTLNNCAPLQGGESFSIEHPTMGWRLYEIATVTPVDANRVIVKFRPPLREDVVDGTRVEFDRPCCTMRLATPSAMDLTVQPWTFNTSSVQFIETPQPAS
jgi:hypothetical protein